MRAPLRNPAGHAILYRGLTLLVLKLTFLYESTTTRIAGGLDFTATGGKRQGHEVTQSLKTTRFGNPITIRCSEHLYAASKNPLFF